MKKAGLKYPQACIEAVDSKPGPGFERSPLSWIGDATVADAMLDRLLSRSHRLNLKGKSMRPSKPAAALAEDRDTDGPVSHVTEMTGQVPETVGHDAENTGHTLPKYAVGPAHADPISKNDARGNRARRLKRQYPPL